MKRIKNYLIIFCTLFSIAFIGTTIKRAKDFELKYLDLKVDLNNALQAKTELSEEKNELLEAQKQAVSYQNDLTSKLNKIAAKKAVLNRHYDTLKDTYKCERPADAEQVIMQGICDYAEATGGGCK